MKNTGINKLDHVINIYRQTNRIAFVHPRSKTISLNGGRELPYDKAFTKMTETLASIAISK